MFGVNRYTVVITGSQCTAEELQARIEDEKKQEQKNSATSKGKVTALLESALKRKIEALEDVEPKQTGGGTAAVSSRPSHVATELQGLKRLENKESMAALVEDRVQLFRSRPLLFSSLVLNV